MHTGCTSKRTTDQYASIGTLLEKGIKSTSKFCRSVWYALLIPQSDVGLMQAYPGKHMEWMRKSCCKLQQMLFTIAWAAQRGLSGAWMSYKNLLHGGMWRQAGASDVQSSLL